MKFESFVFSPFSENTYVVWDDSLEAVIVDPGCYGRAEEQRLADFIGRMGLKVVKILNTHCHIDHIFGNSFCKTTFGGPLLVPEKDLYNLEGAKMAAHLFGVNYIQSPEPDELLNGGDVVEFGNTKFEVLFTPGHSAGHVSFFAREAQVIFSGDVLFEGSIGRTDLPGGSMPVLMKTIREVILPLGDEVEVYSGHGNPTTVGQERRTNPFLLNYV
ncbi:MAG: MBL fold metallo-hydrolase [Bacteroidia bacterium]|nr:MBL fold metallo-hydrolase [Bacteroidia bacterium]